MAYRRKRISLDQVNASLTRLKALPIDFAQSDPSDIFDLPTLANQHGLTNYDAAYLAVALSSKLPLATTDNNLRRAARSAGVAIASA
jgi:predicted nucleic acid-binding protein